MMMKCLILLFIILVGFRFLYTNHVLVERIV